MTPVVIPSPGGDCFAMYAPAFGPAILMCPPFGDEALKTARVWRDLTVRLGKQGLASLRFDLPGTGNSAGEPTDPNRVEVWRDAVRACATWLAPRHDGRVILFGHRFGALLALDAAASGVKAERLVLLDPPETGAALARYFRARARLERVGPLPEGPDYIQAGGVPLSEASLRAIAALPAPLGRVQFPPALLVLNEPSSSPSSWPDRLRARGSIVETIPFDGHADFVLHDIFRSKPPLAVLDRVTEYLVQAAGPLPPSTRLTRPLASNLSLPGFTETPIQFGPGHQMFGILCRPDFPIGRPALLLPTTGADPCSGMSRMWTELARRLAREGVTSLRFDMCGVGESGGTLSAGLSAARIAAMYSAERVADVRAAVDTLGTLGFDAVRVVGYCAGAYAAWHAAVPETRIAGILAGNLLYLNQQSSATDEDLVQRPGASQIGRQAGTIIRFLPAGSIATLRWLDDSTRAIVPRRARLWLRRWASGPRQTRRHVTALVSRGCSVSLVMSHDDHGHIRLRQAFGEEPRLPQGVELFVLPDADHQFSDRRHRARFLDLAASFALQKSPRLPGNHVSATPVPSNPARVLETA